MVVYAQWSGKRRGRWKRRKISNSSIKIMMMRMVMAKKNDKAKHLCFWIELTMYIKGYTSTYLYKKKRSRIKLEESPMIDYGKKKKLYNSEEKKVVWNHRKK